MTQSKTPNLELVTRFPSPGNDSSVGESTLEKRKKPRINLTTEQFRLTRNGKVYSVMDLSTDGMAFRILDSADLLMFPVATELEGTLNLRGEKHLVRVKVRHLGASGVGCQFIDLSVEAKKGLSQFLDPAELGRELRPIPSSNTGVLWYHGPGGTDLLLNRGVDGQYRRITLFVLGSFVQWDEALGLSTGCAKSSQERIDQNMEEWGVIQFETMILDTDSATDPDKLSIAKALILSSNLPQDLKKWCVRQLWPH